MATNKIKGWIARDETDSLFFYRKKPMRVTINGEYGYWEAELFDSKFELDMDMFTDLEWKDKPVEAEITVKLIKK